ncbi:MULTISPECIES: DEAD/DEAH box helicase [Micromonospora]|uniref:ATP-dependent helicase n=1 Tax=Micromonospora sicca TaxID=2202420 RepID=A0A317DLY0_9ACTN|nr:MULTISPECIES: DEAD/DEAH box helicase [unclassified Micromonospora]MBM0224579.1 DEAD/DEAH box helicase [Micromonospora sp. ATA51]PWR15344.1 ATP-dependent helicase [Micromonospora sp. 4G51]
MFGPSHHAVFRPHELPRAGRLAVWGPAITGPDTIELFHGPAARLHRRPTLVRLLTVAEAVAQLLSVRQASPSVAAWSAATLAGLDLVARGRLSPAVTAAGFGSWRIGPLAAADADRLHALAAAMPPEGHCIVLPDSWPPVRVPEPQALIRDWWDALADTLARSGVDGPFTQHAPVKVRGPLGWLRPDETARTVLRVALPVAPDGPYEIGVWLRSASDPSLLIEADRLWHAPPAVAARFGPAPDTAMLTALHRGARLWPPMAGLLDQRSPRPIEAADDTITDLLGAVETLSGAGIEVLVPVELLGEPLALRAVATPKPDRVAEAAFTLDAMLNFTWRPTVGGEALTEEELAQLAQAKRSLVRLRGQWVRVDHEVLARLRRPRRPLTGIEALAAALSGGLDLDGDWVEFEPTGALRAMTGMLAELPDTPVPADLAGTLRPYQQRGLSWLAGMTESGLGGCLADDMGLGKTIQVIALHLHRQGRGPTLVVCPTTLLGNWEREIRRFAPGVPVRRYHGGERHLMDLAKNEIVLVTYGIVRADAAALAEVGWGLIVADEAQYVKNPLSQTARQLRSLPATARLALTGTPVENKLSELWSILDWTTPGLLGSLSRFTSTMAVPVERNRDPATTERLARLIRPFLLRRRKSDPGIAPELPAKTETDRIVPLTAEQASLYRAVVAQSLADIEASGGLQRRALIVKLLTGLKQICNHPAHYLHEQGPTGGRSGKLAALDDLLDVVLAEGESALVFSQYVQMCRLIERHLAARGIPTLFLSGQTADRDEVVADFQAGTAPVFLLSLKAGGVGLNLTRATHVVHYDRWWNPAVEDQATDRAYRIGQDRPVQVHRLIAEGTVEDRIATMLADKRVLAESVVGAGEHWLADLSTADLADLVTLGSA